MNATQVLALQSLLVFLQTINAASEIGLSPTWRVILAAGIGSLQVFVNRVGNKLDPNEDCK